MIYILLAIAIIIESILVVISNFITIPEWSVFAVGGLILCLLTILLSQKRKLGWKILMAVFSFISIVWAIWSAYFMPYWNSVTLRKSLGMDTPETLDLDCVLDKEQANEDIEYVVTKIKRYHPAYLEEGNCLDSLFCDMLVDDSISVKALLMHLQSTVSKLDDAHTYVYQNYDNYNTIDYSEYGTILAINGEDINTVIKRCCEYISGESVKYKKRMVISKLNSYEELNSIGLIKDSSVTITFSTDSIYGYTVTFTKADFHKFQTTNYFSQTKYGDFIFDEENKIAYLNLRNCVLYKPIQFRNLKSDLRSFFTHIKEYQYENLIIDLRGNPGGNSLIANEILRYYPIRRYSIGKYKFRRGNFMIGREIRLRNIRKKNLLFDGNTYILTSLTTFSAAMMTADFFQGNGLAKVVGESPGNNANSYSNVAFFVLPNSKLSMSISTFKYERVDTTVGCDYIVPDIPCDARDAKDVAYKYILDHQ